MGYATECFSKRLKEIRETAGLTQAQLASELKVSRGAISYYEKGERTPDIEFIDSMANYFLLPIDFILGRTDNIKEENRNMYEFYGLTDDGCDVLEHSPQIGQLFSVIISHKKFWKLKEVYYSIINNYKSFDTNELGYISFLLSDVLNKIIFDSLEVMLDFQLTTVEREALRLKYEISDKEFEVKMKEWDEREKLLKEKWEKEEIELAKQDKEENALRYSAIDKVHEKFKNTVDRLEFDRYYK